MAESVGESRYMLKLEQSPQVRHGNARNIEEFTHLLDITMINLKEAGRDYDLCDGSLYAKLQRKFL